MPIAIIFSKKELNIIGAHGIHQPFSKLKSGKIVALIGKALSGFLGGKEFNFY